MATVPELASRAKAAAPAVARASTSQKNQALINAADQLLANATEILAANERDLTSGRDGGISDTVLDRLRLDPSRIESMANGLRLVAGLPDPVGEVADGWVRPNGLQIRRVRVPLGVIGIIYENRPNVTSDAAGLCLKSGNVAFLRGSSGAIQSNIAIARALRSGVAAAGLPDDSVVLIDDTSRESAIEFRAGDPVSSRAFSITQQCRTSSTVMATATSMSTNRQINPWRSTSSRTRRPSDRVCATPRNRSWCTNQ
jgi:glutamate-5-semialdehyde dehydrogenase